MQISQGMKQVSVVIKTILKIIPGRSTLKAVLFVGYSWVAFICFLQGWFCLFVYLVDFCLALKMDCRGHWNVFQEQNVTALTRWDLRLCFKSTPLQLVVIIWLFCAHFKKQCIAYLQDMTPQNFPKFFCSVSLLVSLKHAKGVMSCKYNIFGVWTVYSIFLSPMFMLGISGDENFCLQCVQGGWLIY